MLPTPKTNTPSTTDPQYTKQIQTQAIEVLQLSDPPKLKGIPVLFNKAIATIIHKANRKLVDSLRKKEDQLYKKSTKMIQQQPRNLKNYSLTPKTKPILSPNET